VCLFFLFPTRTRVLRDFHTHTWRRPLRTRRGFPKLSCCVVSEHAKQYARATRTVAVICTCARRVFGGSARLKTTVSVAAVVHGSPISPPAVHVCLTFVSLARQNRVLKITVMPGKDRTDDLPRQSNRPRPCFAHTSATTRWLFSRPVAELARRPVRLFSDYTIVNNYCFTSSSSSGIDFESEIGTEAAKHTRGSFAWYSWRVLRQTGRGKRTCDRRQNNAIRVPCVSGRIVERYDISRRNIAFRSKTDVTLQRRLRAYFYDRTTPLHVGFTEQLTPPCSSIDRVIMHKLITHTQSSQYTCITYGVLIAIDLRWQDRYRPSRGCVRLNKNFRQFNTTDVTVITVLFTKSRWKRNKYFSTFLLFVARLDSIKRQASRLMKSVTMFPVLWAIRKLNVWKLVYGGDEKAIRTS